MLDKDLIKYSSLAEAREDLIKETKVAQTDYRE